jgi:hypothetical protein
MIRNLTLAIIFYFLNVAGCSHSVSPIDHNGSSGKDPRTYTWTLDTLFYTPTPNDWGQTEMYDFWGFNDTLIYAVGYDGNYGYGSMWKFDGKHWTRVHLNVHEGGTIGKAFYLRSIEGFAENDIYAFGNSYTNFTGSTVNSAFGIHYDGIQWSEITMPKGFGIWSSVASSPSTIYCGGSQDGQLYHYDGVKWSVDTMASVPYPDLIMNVHVMGASSTQGVYLQTEQWMSAKNESFLYQQIIKHDSKASLVLDSAVNAPPWGGITFWQSKTGNIYSCGQGGIFLLSGNKWNSFYSTDFIYSMFGSSEQHIFAVGYSNVYFYDGKTWETVIPYYGVNFEIHIWCSERQVFISYSDGVRTYVLHGK